ncbi:MAG TPA: retropepsin-like aspartic protease [Rhizomicrobium sp.]|nr:retropepsin-like aspartic protease [Rhizomicrobium sp.]
MRPKLLAIALLAAAAIPAVGAAAADAPACHLGRYASLPMTIDEAGLVTVPIKIGGEEENLLVDTGGVFSMLTSATAARLNLKPVSLDFGAAMYGWGGRRMNHYVEAEQIEIAGATIKRRQFMVMPDDFLPLDDDGILAPDILSVFEVDFDFAKSQMGLFSKDHCEGKVVYWTHDDYAAIPFDLDSNRHMKITITLDGKEVHAILDTGASDSVMSLETARSMFGFKPSAIAETGRYPFKSLTIQGVTVNNPVIDLVPDDKSKMLGNYGEPDMILGMGILRQLHLFISFKEHTVYVTPASAH